MHPNHNGESFMYVNKALLKDILEIDAGCIVKVFSIDSYDFDNIEPKSGAPMLKPLGQRKMTEIYVRDGASFLKEIDKFGFEKGYWQYSYQIPAHPMWFNKEEIEYVSEHNRSMSCYGYARTQAIIDIVKSLHYSTLFNKRYFEESAIPDGALSVLDTSPEEMQAFMSYWNNEFKAQPHKMAIINKDMKWQPFTMNNTELQFLETQKWYYNIVVAEFGLSLSEMGVTEDLNRSTSATQSELVKRKSIRPFLKLLEGAWNNVLKEFGYEGTEFTFIYDDPAEKSARLKNYQMELQMGIKTVNEVRNELGMEPLPNGDTNGLIMQQESLRQQSNNPEDQHDSKNERESSEAKEPKQKGVKSNVQTMNDEQRERKIEIVKPFSPQNRAGGDFKSYEKLSDKELIEEHKRLVAVLESGDKEELKAEAKRQKAELEDYLRRDAKKGFDDGQYYREQPISQPNRPSGAMFQPQNPVPGEGAMFPSALGSSYAKPGVDDFRNNLTLCPVCGQETLSVINSEETINEDIRCTACGSRFSSQELLAGPMMEAIANTLQESNRSVPVSIPEFKPKSFEFDKDFGGDMTIKDFVGFDVSKTFPFSLDYANSAAYRKLLRSYLGELSSVKCNAIIAILKNSMLRSETISDVSKKINSVINDEERAKVIARTEIVRLSNEGNIERIKQGGVIDEVEFISAPEDGRLCENCKNLDGKIYKLKDARGVIPVHPRCRCSFGGHIEI